METIICLTLSIIGSRFGGLDFFSSYTVLSVALSLYKRWNNLTNDNHVM